MFDRANAASPPHQGRHGQMGILGVGVELPGEFWRERRSLDEDPGEVELGAGRLEHLSVRCSLVWRQVVQGPRVRDNGMRGVPHPVDGRPDRFDGVTWHTAPTGSPVVDRAVAWIDCDVEDVYTMGDHYFVLGRVRALDADANHDGQPPQPLVFYRGSLGGFAEG